MPTLYSIQHLTLFLHLPNETIHEYCAKSPPKELTQGRSLEPYRFGGRS
jgi:hypothetical protein